ncbi:MAG: methyltransferase domain-containing protein [Gammaproteobacteria bacterium]|nr:methyltransferase domain-containing protein [Gammaproteobacteria bacterium]
MKSKTTNPTRSQRRRQPRMQMTSSQGFYYAFEDRHRGSRELIKDRLHVYLPFIEPIQRIADACSALDLGCGRGEWLELLQEQGFDATGVDLDANMVAECQRRGLDATQHDALAYLKRVPDDSHWILSGFHFVEHIDFASLQSVILEGLRILKPGGLLILETPNPENLIVGTSDFYLDPTHERPLPPPLLSFLAEYHGFERVEILRLQEPHGLHVKQTIALFDVFRGVSPDYAVIAQKRAAPEVLSPFASAFGQNHGIQLNDLAERYDATLRHRFNALEQRIGTIETTADSLHGALAQIESLNNRLLDTTAEVERNRARLARQDLQIEQANSELSEQRQRSESAAAQALAQTQRADAAEALAATHAQRADTAEAYVAELQAQAAIAEQQAGVQRRQTATVEAQAAELRQHIEAARAQVAAQTQRAAVAEANAKQHQQRIATLEQEHSELATRLADRSNRIAELDDITQAQQAKITELTSNRDRWREAAECFDAERRALRQSWSWRITAPVRWVAALGISALRMLRQGTIRLVHFWTEILVSRPLAAMMKAVLRNQALSDRINHRLLRYPGLHDWLIQFARGRGLAPGMPIFSIAPIRSDQSDSDQPDLSELTPRARQIYRDLTRNMANQPDEKS